MAETRSTGGGRVTRRQLLTGAGAAAIGGLVVGGAGGWAIGSSGDDDGGSGGTGGTGGTGGGDDGGGGETILLGSASPTSGAYSGDGQEMTRGQELAIAEINANGGVLGRQLELVVADVEDLAPEKMVNAARRLTNEGVAAVFSGYTSTTSAEYDVYAQYGAPMFHLNTFQPNADYVADNGIKNIYHSCPTEVWYGPGFIQFMQRVIDSGAWTPSSETRSGHHEQRPVQHLDRADGPGRASRRSAGRSRSTSRSRHRSPNGGRCWRRSGRTHPA